MSTASRYQPHYSYDDYCHWQGDWELWDGTAVAMTPSPFGPHERIVSRLVYLLQAQIEQQACDCVVYAGLDWVVNQHIVVRPDVMVVCGNQPQEHLRRHPDVVIEILSPSTEAKDRIQKRQLYAEQSVPTYLIVDPLAGVIETLCLRNGAYVNDAQPTTIELACACRLELAKEAVFPSLK